MAPCPFPHLPRRVSWDTTVGENTERARAGTTAEWTGGGHDTAMQQSRLLLPPSPSYPHTPEPPCPHHSFPPLQHRAVWDATVEENTWRGRVEGHSPVARGGDIAALQPPCLLLLSPYLITTLAGLHVGDCPPHYRPHSSLTQGHTPFPSPPPSTPKGVEHCSGGERGEDTEGCRVGEISVMGMYWTLV